MNDFDALLKRSFAECEEPADNGFSVRVERSVARREARAKNFEIVRGLGWGVAAAAVAYALIWLAQAFGLQSLLSFAGDEVGEARAALASGPSVGDLAGGLNQALSAGMTQFLLVAAALAGGAVAYRASQE